MDPWPKQRAKTMILLEENIGISFHDLGIGSEFLVMISKQEKNIDKLDFIWHIYKQQSIIQP